MGFMMKGFLGFAFLGSAFCAKMTIQQHTVGAPRVVDSSIRVKDFKRQQFQIDQNPCGNRDFDGCRHFLDENADFHLPLHQVVVKNAQGKWVPLDDSKTFDAQGVTSKSELWWRFDEGERELYRMINTAVIITHAPPDKPKYQGKVGFWTKGNYLRDKVRVGFWNDFGVRFYDEDKAKKVRDDYRSGFCPLHLEFDDAFNLDPCIFDAVQYQPVTPSMLQRKQSRNAKQRG